MQNDELAYAIMTPYSMRKSRTGGIIARLISRTGLDLVAARMFAPSEELVRRYAETIVTETEPRHRATQELIRDYVSKKFHRGNRRRSAAGLSLGFLAEPMPSRKCGTPSVILCTNAPAVKRFATRLAITSPTIRAR